MFLAAKIIRSFKITLLQHTEIQVKKHLKSKNLELILLGSSQMTTGAQRCLYPFHPYRLRSSLTTITASSTCIKGILRFGLERDTVLVPMRVKMKYVCQVESISPYRIMPQSNNAHVTLKHQWTKCTIHDTILKLHL